VHKRTDAKAGASSILIAVAVVALLIGAAASYWLYALPGHQNASLASSSQLVTQTSATSSNQSSSSQAPSTATSSTQLPSQTSSTIPFATSSSNGYPALSFKTPPGAIAIVIPDGIDLPTAKGLNITFSPVTTRVVLGVNNTVYFLNKDIDFTLGHVIQTTLWPSDGKPFVFNTLPGEVTKVTLSTPGVYNYTCIWHPIWMHGSITVVSNGG
jgi:plastocyanin